MQGFITFFIARRVNKQLSSRAFWGYTVFLLFFPIVYSPVDDWR